MLPESRRRRSSTPVSSTPVLERRTPGDTDLSIFTTALPYVGRHRRSLGRRLRPYARGRHGGVPNVPRAGVLAVAAVLALAGCSTSTSATEGGQAATNSAEAGSARSLKDVCPATIVIQSSWFSQVEHFAAYQLLGKGYTVDAAKKTVTGPLVTDGVNTGVKIQIRAGGPAIGLQQVSAQMYADRSITLGMVPLDEAIQNSASQPVTGVMTPYDIDPLAIIWSLDKHPDWHNIADIGQTNRTVLFFQGERTYMDYLLGSGILRQSQVDGSYDGSPSRFVAARGDIAVQGFATSEPWRWEHEVAAWNKPLDYQLVSDTGYPNYRNLLAIRSGDKQQLAPCLQKLVPLVQRATVAFMANPLPTIKLILGVVTATKQGYQDSEARSEHAVEVMRSEGLVTNGRDHTIGEFDLSPGGRVQKLINIDTPIYAGQRKALKRGLQPADIATNEFINPAIGLPSGK
jgi:hypothetical protein